MNNLSNDMSFELDQEDDDIEIKDIDEVNLIIIKSLKRLILNRN